MLRREDQTPENRQRLHNIYEAIVHSLCITELGDVFQKHLGNPSGCANTIVDNTIIMFVLLAYAWIMNINSSYEDFIKHVMAVLCGDDNTFTVSDEMIPHFNATVVMREWKAVNITATTDDENPREVKDLDFLSQTFIEHKGMMLPKPDYNKVMCSLESGNDTNDVRWSLLRAYALRNETWSDVKCRDAIIGYIHRIRKKSGNALIGACKGVEMSVIQSQWKTDYELECLYTGYEDPTAKNIRNGRRHFTPRCRFDWRRLSRVEIDLESSMVPLFSIVYVDSIIAA
jgi:hypothetical protein